MGQFNFVAAGDVNSGHINDLLENRFNKWEQKKTTINDLLLGGHPSKANEKRINITDKMSLDMYIGQAVGIDRDHEDYYALMMGIYILGGNFSARLMQNS